MTVEELLTAKDMIFRPQGKDFLIHCLSPEHDDSAPSTRVDKLSGVFHCLSCGHKGNLYTEFNEIRDYQSEKVLSIRQRIRDIITSSKGLNMPTGAVPFTREFRGIKPSTFRTLGVFTHDDFEDRLVFPVQDVSGKIVAFCARHILSDASPKYIVSPAEVKMPLYPSNTKPYLGNVILVEGIFDAVNLIDKGMTNVVCLFGTRTLSYNNIEERMMPLLLAGTKSVTIMLDGDKAGITAAADLEKLIKMKTRLVVDTLKLSEGTDPGSLDQATVTAIKAQLYSKEN